MRSTFVGRGVLAGTLLMSAGHSAPVTRAQATGEVGTIRVHLLGHAIGSERYAIRPDGDALALTDTFEFVDRGGRIQLASTLRFTPAFAQLHLRSTGRIYRFVNVDADVRVDGDRVHVRNLDDSATIALPKTFFAIAGYAPIEAQALLVRYWQTHGRPPTIVTAPGDPTTTVSVQDLGSASLDVAPGERVTLRRFSINGVAWGREILYLDSASRFAAIVTRANLLPLEGIREDLAASHAAMLDSVLADAALADQGVRPHLSDLDVEDVANQLRAGKRLNVFRSLSGEYGHSFLPEPTRIHPQIVIMETYRLSSFLGQFGAGRTLKTFSLLPGEKTTISVKTFRKSESDSKSASSVLDSFTKESADDFENSLQQEQSDKKASQDSFEYHAEAEADVSWGFGSAKVSGGVKGGTASQREEFAKNVSNAVNKHASKASSKRDVQVNTASEVKEASGEETSITRQLENINVGRVLNFVFRQMNQEHITLLHLVDVRVAFWNGFAESVEEVPLPKLDTILDKYIQPGRKEEVRQLIVDQLSTIFDFEDNLVDPPVIQEKAIAGDDTYLRFRKDLISTFTDETGNQISVPGVILSANKIVMRTEGIIVDAILGQGNALDTYSQGLQENVVKQRTLENDERQARVDQESLARDIVDADDEDKAKVFERVFRDAVTLPGKVTVSAADKGVSVSTEVEAAPGPE